MLDSWMLDALGDVSGKTVIDIGCGEGRFCRLLAELGAVVTGVDLTEPLIERARSLGSDREMYTVGDAEDLDGVCDGSFDLAVSYIVLVDLLDYQRSIREAYRVLRPGGRFVVCNVHPMRSAVISSEGWIKDGDRKLFYALDNYTEEGPREFNWWDRSFVNMHRTVSGYASAFLDAGFVLECDFMSRCPPMINWPSTRSSTTSFGSRTSSCSCWGSHRSERISLGVTRLPNARRAGYGHTDAMRHCHARTAVLI